MKKNILLISILYLLIFALTHFTVAHFTKKEIKNILIALIEQKRFQGTTLDDVNFSSLANMMIESNKTIYIQKAQFSFLLTGKNQEFIFSEQGYFAQKFSFNLKHDNLEININAINIYWTLVRQLVSALLITGIIIMFFSLLRRRNQKERYLIMTQIAHDIRSPLATISEGIKDNFSNPDLIRLAAERLESIANNLLSERRKETKKIVKKNFNEFLQLIIQEKSIQYKNLDPIINIILAPKAPDLGISLIDLSRILSNILNNAFESNNRPEVTIETRQNQNIFQIIISDNGPGISPHILKQIGKKSITTKAFGNGIGLLSAFKKMHEWGGDIIIQNKTEKGMSISLNFPFKGEPFFEDIGRN